MRAVVEMLLRIWPLNRIAFAVWRYFPFPRGARSRIISRANDRFLVGVVILIYDDDHRLMLVRNTYEPRYSWTLPGGWMGRHEQPEECIRREIYEETGYQVAVDELVAARTQSKLPSVDLIYRGRIISGTFRASAEVVEIAFFALNELPDGLTPVHRVLLEQLELKPVGEALDASR